MSRTMGKPFAMSKCIMLAVCVVCAASVFMMAAAKRKARRTEVRMRKAPQAAGKQPVP